MWDGLLYPRLLLSGKWRRDDLLSSLCLHSFDLITGAKSRPEIANDLWTLLSLSFLSLNPLVTTTDIFLLLCQVRAPPRPLNIYKNRKESVVARSKKKNKNLGKEMNRIKAYLLLRMAWKMCDQDFAREGRGDEGRRTGARRRWRRGWGLVKVFTLACLPQGNGWN